MLYYDELRPRVDEYIEGRKARVIEISSNATVFTKTKAKAVGEKIREIDMETLRTFGRGPRRPE